MNRSNTNTNTLTPPLTHFCGQRSQYNRCRALVIALLLLGSVAVNTPILADNKPIPPLMLAKPYQASADLDITKYWVSEKYDGVRAYWNGQHLLSRRGNVYRAPAWFTADFPAEPLDGELWLKRQSFELLSGIVRRKKAQQQQWCKVRYMVFDLPADNRRFDHRLQALQELVGTNPSPYLQLVPQQKFSRREDLLEHLKQITAAGAEGLMLHLGSSFYQARRSNDLIKLKPSQDAEATVVAILPGKGKYLGKMGALLLEDPHGLRFKIGSGFSDSDRSSPPPLGSLVSYQYNGRTNTGLPRFPRFMRRRPVF